MTPWLFLHLLVAAVLLVCFTVLWAWCHKVRNASWVDVGWCFGMLLALLAAVPVWRPTSPAGWALAGLGAAWSLRLGLHLARRVAREHPREDSRYAGLRQRWGEAPGRWWLIFAGQAGVILLLVQPWWRLLMIDPVGWSWAQTVGTGLVLVGIGGEALADRQLRRFLSWPESQRGDGVCRAGLWGWSRHPNYFFESISWWGFWLFAWVPGTALAPWLACAISPLTMLVLLRYVTGVPPAERSSLKSKTEAYRRYQQEVSVFLPLPPRK